MDETRMAREAAAEGWGAQARRRARRLPPGVRELALFALALAAYQASRAIVIGDATGAVRHAWDVIDLERGAGVFWEPAIQGWATGHPGLVQGLNAFYLLAHLPMTALFFVWLWRTRRDRYAVVRNGFLAANAVALGVFIAFPVAPPRLVGADGLVDTLRQASGVDLHGGALSGLFNPYAAVPSMHVAFALMIGMPLAVLAKHRAVRWFWTAYPLLVTFVIVMTANHFVFDAILGALTAGCAYAAAFQLARARPVWGFRAAPAGATA
jgi:uncharacterized membrane protein (Fun14 family)